MKKYFKSGAAMAALMSLCVATGVRAEALTVTPVPNEWTENYDTSRHYEHVMQLQTLDDDKTINNIYYHRDAQRYVDNGYLANWNLGAHTLTINNNAKIEDGVTYAVLAQDSQLRDADKYIRYVFNGGAESKLVIKPQEGETSALYGLAQAGEVDVGELEVHGRNVVSVDGNIEVEDNTSEKVPLKATLKANKMTIVSRDGGTGLFAQNEGQINVTAGELNITDVKNGIRTAGDKSKNTITVTKSLNITAKDGESSGTAISAADATNSEIYVDASSAQAIINGNIVAGSDQNGGNKITLIMGAGSEFTGKVVTGKNNTVNVTNLTLNDGAEWQVTGDSTVTDLALNDGAVALNGADVAVETYAGNGTVAVDVTAEDMGSLNAGASASGSSVTVDMGDADNVTDERAQNAMAAVAGVNGAEKSGVASEGMAGGETHYDANGKVVVKKDNSVMEAAETLANTQALSLNRILMNDVRKRMGDIRSMKAPNGTWVRYEGGRLSADNAFKSKFNTLQLGADTAITDSVRLGLAGSYTFADSDFKRGSADMKAYSLAAYGLYKQQNGLFVDTIARVAKARTEVEVDGDTEGMLQNTVLSLSSEIGWRKDLAKGFFVEPQLEATYSYINSDELKFKGAKTATYDYDSVNSLVGRLGGVFGIQCPNNARRNFYVRASVVREFLGDTVMTGQAGAVTNKLKTDGADTWFEFGAGANYNLTDAANVWVDVERTEGAELEEDYRVNVGLRYNF